MPKLKSHKGAAKRFLATGKGSFKFRRKKRNHRMRNRTTKVKRQARSLGRIGKSNLKAVRTMLRAR
ncbi:MAG: 50S ribosomal protein L35 [Thiotrichales bacterium]|nr:MAG: 50S ribosomal protein L35 [Thiotrichales bacterium]